MPGRPGAPGESLHLQTQAFMNMSETVGPRCSLALTPSLRPSDQPLDALFEPARVQLPQQRPKPPLIHLENPTHRCKSLALLEVAGLPAPLPRW